MQRAKSVDPLSGDMQMVSGTALRRLLNGMGRRQRGDCFLLMVSLPPSLILHGWGQQALAGTRKRMYTSSSASARTRTCTWSELREI